MVQSADKVCSVCVSVCVCVFSCCLNDVHGTTTIRYLMNYYYYKMQNVTNYIYDFYIFLLYIYIVESRE